MRGIDMVNRRNPFPKSIDKTRGRRFKARHRRERRALSGVIFTLRVISWNALPKIVVEADSRTTFEM